MRRRLPWLLLGAWGLLTLTGVVQSVVHGDLGQALILPALGVLAGVGALLSARRPENPVGWMLLGLAVLISAGVVAEGVYVRAEDDPAPSLLVRLLVWYDAWTLYVWFGVVGIALPLLFPDGRLPSPRWRPVAWAGAAVTTITVVGTAFGSARFEAGSALTNPLAVGGTAGEVLDGAVTVGGFGYAAVLLCALTGVALRLRRATGVERQQLKWFAFAIGLVLGGLVAAFASEITGFGPLGAVGWWLFLLSLIFAMPMAVALAILRHRLYDIDLVIRRALVYGGLSALLAAVYLGLVLLIGLAVGSSGFDVAASTLAVAALVRPARARIQAGVDRRFYRQRYDAAGTVAGFGARLRDEVDLQALSAELRRVVGETVAPAHVSLWLRSER